MAALLAATMLSSITTARADGTVKVGVLQSLSGTMAISEVPLEDAELLAIDQINAAGGLLGKQIVPVEEDGASDPSTFAQKATKLIEEDKRFHNLLWYPVQFEGNECSPNIMYSGAQPNQQALPALTWAEQKGYKSYFLLGSDYVYPRTANLVLKKHIAHDGMTLAGEEYVPLGGTDFSSIIAEIQQSKPDIIINTLNGDSNVSFFKQMAAAGLTPDKLPVMSFSIAEPEAKAMGPSLLAGSYTSWNYFQSLPGATNAAFVAAYKAKFGADSVVDDPMVHGYADVYEWAAAIR
jgi:urea transport system substrate-binding protein